MTTTIKNSNNLAKEKLLTLLDEIIAHDGFGEIRVEVNILKRKQKEVIIHCGKQYRFVVDAP
ncbi:MAG: hypothetical protein COA59_11720 [Colwellia sp.]|jgi:hypothetical protein|nr:MAG: hypothetical protein COA59_11720 [Colwellia sp.]